MLIAAKHTTIAVVLSCLLILGAAGDGFAENAFDWNSAGVAFYEAEDWSAAVSAFEKAYDLGREDEVIKRNLANAYQALAGKYARDGDFRTAIDYLGKAVRIDPENASPLIQLGAYYLHEGKVATAIQRLEKAIELDPFDVDAHFLLGEAYYKDNDVTAAVDQWEWVYRVEPGRDGLVDRLETALREEEGEAVGLHMSSVHFHVTYDPGTTPQVRTARNVLATRVTAMLEQAYREIGREFGGVFPRQIVPVKLYEPSGFSFSTGMGEHVGAVFDGTKITMPILDSQGAQLAEDELRRRIYHEYVHVLVRHVARESVPWWFNEGLAEVLSRDLTADELRYLQHAHDAGRLFPMQDLEAEQLDRLSVPALQLAYRQSHAAVTLLKERYGIHKLVAMLNALSDGKDPEAALRFACRYTYRTLDLALAKYITKADSSSLLQRTSRQ